MHKSAAAFLCALVAAGLSGCVIPSSRMPQMVEIPAGSFIMGTDNARMEDADESPAHQVTISAPFRMSTTEITNLQYEAFCPSHKKLRGDGGFSSLDNEAVVNVSYDDAAAYCKWLSKRTGRSFRLPTEAEWEYACKAGTSSPYFTGDTIPASMQKHQQTERNLVAVSLEVGKSEANAFGLYDMHGNVEEWCLDWYAPYPSCALVNPAGSESGQYRVTRGGSHNTPVEFLRSASRSAATPDDTHTQIGFRVVESDALLSYHNIAFPCPLYAKEVSEQKWWNERKSLPSKEPFFMEPIPYVIDPQDGTPFYRHNHQPAVTWCDNGDLLAIWFSCNAESWREMVVLASRLRAGSNEWEKASIFFKVPDRNMTGSSLLRLADGTLLHMNGVGNSGDWQNLALCARRSTDNGATWTDPVLVAPRHVRRHQVISGPIVLSDGTIVQLCDAGADGQAGTAVQLSRDNGLSWSDPWDGVDAEFVEGGKGTTIAGIHASVVELKDGSLMALGRGNSINERMPMSISTDGGKSWTYSASQFAPIGSGQRHVFMRLNEGALMLASFGERGMQVCVSFDEGKSWTEPKLLTDGKRRLLNGGAHTGEFIMSADSAEPKGYFCCTQTPDGTIHLLSSRLHYRFNLAWILTY